MKVGELIAALQGMDPEVPVLVSGYEDGFDDCSLSAALVWRRTDPTVGAYMGRYASSSSAVGPSPDDPSLTAIVLERRPDCDS